MRWVQPRPAFIILGVFLACFLLGMPTPVSAITPSVGAPILAATNLFAGTGGAEAGSNGCFFVQITCAPDTTMVRWSGSLWFIVYPTTALSGSTTTFNYVYSSDGTNWNGPVVLLTTGQQISLGGSAAQTWGFDVQGSSLDFAYLFYGGSTTTVGIEVKGISVLIPAAPTVSSAEAFYNGGVTQGANARPWGVDVRIINGIPFFAFIAKNGASGNIEYINFGASSFDSSVTMSGSCLNGNPINLVTSGVVWNGALSNSANCGTINVAGTLFTNGAPVIGFGSGTAYIPTNGASTLYAAPVVTAAATACEVDLYNLLKNTFTITAPSGAGTCGSYPLMQWTKSDGASNLWTYFQATNVFSFSTDGGTTFGAASLGIATVAGAGKSLFPVSMSDINTVQGVPMSLIVGVTCTAASCGPGAGYTLTGNLYVIQVTLGSPVPVTQSSTIGQCPTKNNNVFRPVNSTQYFYVGANNFAQNMFVTVDIGTLFTVSAPVTVVLSAYTTDNIGTLSAVNPLKLRSSIAISLNVGQQPFGLTWAPTWTDTSPTGAQFAVAVQASNKISINQSGLAGLQTGTAASLTVPASSFSSLASTTTQLALCSVNTYAQVSVQTVTVGSVSTTTTITSTTFTATTTSTTTATTIDANSAATTSTGATLMLLVILIPAVVLGFAGAITKSPTLAGGGFISGLAIGAGVGNQAGLVPFWLLGVIVIAIVFMIIGLLMLMRGGGG